MSEAALPLTDEDDGPLSPWWVRAVLIVMALGFAGLIAVTLLAYRNAPPIPTQAMDPAGTLQFDQGPPGRAGRRQVTTSDARPSEVAGVVRVGAVVLLADAGA